MSNHEFLGEPNESTAIARLAERIANNDRRYDERWRADQQAVKEALAAAEKAVSAALSAAEKAVEKAELATAARFESVNEFRAQLGDQARTLMPRAEFETQHAEVVRQLGELRAVCAELRQAIAVGPAELKVLQSRADRDTGRAEEASAQLALATAAKARAIALAAVAVTLAVGVFAGIAKLFGA